MASNSSGKKKNTGSSSSRRGSRSTSSRKTSAKRTGTKKAGTGSRALTAQEERHAREVRRDIRLLVLFAAMVFLFLSAIGYGGQAGGAVSGVIFGLFGTMAYVLPFFIFFMVIFVISNLGRKTLPAKCTALIFLFLSAGVIFELRADTLSPMSQYNAGQIYQRCSAAKEGGGLISGSIAFWLYDVFNFSGTVLILIAVILICLLVISQHSVTAAMRNMRRRRMERGELSFIEKGKAQLSIAAQDAAERRQDHERLRRERVELKEKERAKYLEEVRRKRAASDEMDLEQISIRKQEEELYGVNVGNQLHRGTRTPLSAGSRTDRPNEFDSIPDISVPDGTVKFTEGTDKPTAGAAGIRTAGSRMEAGTARAAVDKESPKGTEGAFYVLKAEEPADTPAAPAVRQEQGNGTGARRPSVTSVIDPGFTEQTVFSGGEKDGGGGARPEFPFEKDRAAKTPGREVRTVYASPVLRNDVSEASVSPSVSSSSDNVTLTQEPPVRPKEPEEPEKPEKPEKPVITREQMEEIQVHRDRGEGLTSAGKKNVPAKNKTYVFPPYRLLQKGMRAADPDTDRILKENGIILQETMRTFGVNVKITAISQGPSVTRYELVLDSGVKVSKIVSLADNIKLSLGATDVRIEAPIPGKKAIGIEVPNKKTTLVTLRDILESDEFALAKSRLTFAVGKDISGRTVVTDISKMPHLLIAGATGSGKSVCINTIILSLLFKATPEEVKMIMIDPKVVELNVYNGIPHLMIPVVTDPKKASAALGWAAAEMDKRYKLFAEAGVRDLNGYNHFVSERIREGTAGEEKVLPRLVIIVDELADLMMIARNEVETTICRLLQLARAAGIHMVIATQRPSVDVITGLIKSNMPSRIAFAVASQVDSRTILDMGGAEKLIGKGDMLFYPQSYPKPVRLQGAFVSDEEVEAVVAYITDKNPGTEGDEETEAIINEMSASSDEFQGVPANSADRRDEHFEAAGRFVIEKDKASIGLLQRVFKIGFNRAARIMDQLCEAGVVSEESGTKARQVLMTMPEFENFLQNEK